METTIALIIGLAAGALLVHLRARGAAARHTDELEALELQNLEMTGRAEAAERGLHDAEAHALRREGERNAEIAKLRAELDAERRSADEKAEAVRAAGEQVLAQVKQGAGEALKDRGEELIKTLTAQLETKRVESDGDLERRQKAVEETVAPINSLLEQVKAAVDESNKERQRAETQFSTQIKGLLEAQQELRAGADTLTKALRQPHTRGRWGEMNLRRLAELTGMSEHCDFTEQVTTDGEEGPLRPDAIFHLPGSRDVIVNVKAPLGAYLNACEATDEKAVAAAVELFARGLRAHVKKLASKDYASQFETAPDFVVMYLPGEHFLTQALEVDPGLIEYGAERRVFIATPGTLIAMLRTIALCWQQERASAQAAEIAAVGQKLYERIGKYLKHVDTVSKRLNSAVSAQNDAVGSLERMVLPAARRFPELGAVAVNDGLPDTRAIESQARSVTATELDEGADRAAA